MDRNDGWNIVNRKKPFYGRKGRMDTAGFMLRGAERETVSYYFSEIPDTHRAIHMFRIFKLYGNVVDVVIPPRRNKRGKRYGFARFWNVKDPELFAIKLDNIIIGATKIHVNVPRHQREKKGEYNLKNRDEMTGTHRKKEVVSHALGEKGEDARCNDQWRRGGSNATNLFKKRNEAELTFVIPEEKMKYFREMYVGVVKNTGSTHMVQEWMSMQGFFSVKVTPMGANKVLLEELEEGIIQALLEDAGAWVDEIFEALARKFGVLLGVDDNTEKKSSLDVARLLIRTKCYDVFNMVIHARINESMFHVKMVEEWCGPMRWSGLTKASDDGGTKRNEDSDSSSDSDDGPPLFAADDDGEGWSENEVEVEKMLSLNSSGSPKVVGETEEINGSDDNKVVVENKNDNEVPSELVAHEGPKDNENVVLASHGNLENVAHAVNEDVEAHTLVHVSHRNVEKVVHVFNENMEGQPLGSHTPRGAEGQYVVPSISITPSTFVEDSFHVDGGMAEVNTGVVLSAQGGESSKHLSENRTKRTKKKRAQKKAGWLSRRSIRTKNREGRKKRREEKVECLHCSSEDTSSKEVSSASKNTESFRNLDALETAQATSLSTNVSVGDSGIIAGNNRWREAHDRGIAVKLWKVAKDSLGVVGNGDDETHIQKIKEMEARDQRALSQKGKKKLSQ